MTTLEEAFAQVRAKLRSPEHVAYLKALRNGGSEEDYIAFVRNGGTSLFSGQWDCATPAQRALLRPEFNPNKRWYEQPENRAVRRT